MSFAEEILKDSVVNKEGAGVDLATHCAGKILLLYFSAHWCPPCKDFTPKLARFYTANHETKNFEVVYVSFDKDKLEFEEYYKEMPWLAVKYSERDLQESLSDKFQIEGVPTLVVLNATTGMVLNTDAYSDCLGDPEGAKFPWKCELDDE